MPRLIVTAGAVRGLERCRQFLAKRNRNAAVRAGQAIERQFGLLENNPENPGVLESLAPPPATIITSNAMRSPPLLSVLSSHRIAEALLEPNPDKTRKGQRPGDLHPSPPPFLTCMNRSNF